MTNINVDDFYKDCGKTLSMLYGNFPRNLTLFVEDISGTDDPDEFGIHGLRYQACFAALAWMADEKWLRFDSKIREDALDQVVLTLPCFALLSKPLSDLNQTSDKNLPESVQGERATYIYQIRQALRAKSSTQIAGIMNRFIQELAQRS